MFSNYFLEFVNIVDYFLRYYVYHDDLNIYIRLSASPLRLLATDSSLLASWPATMIVHGELDGIVPIEHSFHFLSILATDDNLTIDKEDNAMISKNNDIIDDSVHRTGPLKANEISRESCVDDNKEETTEIKHDQKNLASIIDKTENAKINKFRRLLQIDATDSGTSNLNNDENGLIDNIKNDHDINDKRNNKWRIRPQDLMIDIPGAKHSFEAVGGATLSIVTDGIVEWLSKIPITKATKL
jgi:hypothetical protein